MHTKVVFLATANFAVQDFVWSGADEMSRDEHSSKSERQFRKPGTQIVTVTPIARGRDGVIRELKEYAKSISITITHTPAERISVHMTDEMSKSPLVRPAKTVLTCHAVTNPPGYEDLIEWTGGGTPEVGWGKEFSTSYKTRGRYTLSAGPSDSVDFDVYEVSSIHRASRYGETVWSGYPITFTATTNPIGYEKYVTWSVDTMHDMHTRAVPSQGSGPVFTTTFSPKDESGIMWAQVYADAAPALESADASCPIPTISIRSPVAGETLSADELALVFASLGEPYDDPNLVGNVEIFASRPGFPDIPIGSGDLRSPMGVLRNVHGFWDPAGVASGTYSITVRVTPAFCGAAGQSTVIVNVNQPPVVSNIQVVGCSSVLGTCGVNGFCTNFPSVACTLNTDCTARQVTLNAVASDPDGDSITEYIWDPGSNGDPVRVTGTSLFTTTYPPGTTTTIVGSTPHDTVGGETATLGDLDVLACTIQATHDCGCEEMTIYSNAGNSFVYCATPGYIIPQDIGCVAVAAPPPGSACAPGDQAFKCPIGPITPGTYFGWGFEVGVVLNDGTNDLTKCEEGQWSQHTVIKNGNVIKALQSGAKPTTPAGGVLNLPDGPTRPGGVNFSIVQNGALYPGFNAMAGGNPQLGADGYDKPGLLKRHLEKVREIQWYDQPLLEPVNPNAAAAYRARFLTYVRGNTGTCWCYFEMDHSWAAGGPRTGPGGAIKLDGERCVIP
jgi:hypothetical protein